jgi:hypothetical protein
MPVMMTRWLALWRGRDFTRPPWFIFRVGDTKKSYHDAVMNQAIAGNAKNSN